MANQLHSDYQSKKFKIWIHTTICVFILSILTIKQVFIRLRELCDMNNYKSIYTRVYLQL